MQINLYIKKGKKDCHEAITAEPSLDFEGIFNVTTAAYSSYCVEMTWAYPDEAVSEEKVLYMAENQIANAGISDNIRLAYPVAAVYDKNMQFVGYMYPKVFEQSIALTTLTTYQRRPMSKMKRFADKPAWHDKYERDEKGMKNRLKLLYNITKALHMIPQHCVPVYLSPDEIFITASGKVTIGKLHLSELCQAGKLIHPLRCVKSEYLSAEGRKRFGTDVPMTQSAALFAYAVIFYQVLTGTHPYSGTVLKAPYDKCVEVSQCIDNDLFAFGQRSEYISFPTGLNLHQAFNTLHPDIQTLFKRAFSSDNSSRPSLEEWGKSLYECIVAMK